MRFSSVLILCLLNVSVLPAAEPLFDLVDSLYRVGADQVTPDVRKLPSRLEYVYRASEDNYKFCHHPCLIEFNGMLYCVWSNGKVGEDEPGQRLALATSRDAQNWSAAKPLFSKDQLKAYDAHVFVASGLLVWDKKLIVFYTITPGRNFHENTALYFSESADGRAFSDPVRITDGFFINPPVVLRNGRLVMGGEYVLAGDRENKRSKLIYHDGMSLATGWTESSLDEGDISRIGYAEPNFIERPHDLVGFFRNYTGHLLVSRSRDSGKSWDPLSDSGIPDSTARFATGSLPGGQRYVIGNTLYKKFDRRALLISLSSDQGQLFDRCFVVRDEPAMKRFEGQHKLDGWQYPHGIVWNNKLLVVHSVNKEDVAISIIKLRDLGTEKRKEGRP